MIEIERATKSAADSAPLTISHRAAAFLRYRIYRTRFFANNATSFLLVRLNLEMIQFFLYFFFCFLCLRSTIELHPFRRGNYYYLYLLIGYVRTYSDIQRWNGAVSSSRRTCPTKKRSKLSKNENSPLGGQVVPF